MLPSLEYNRKSLDSGQSGAHDYNLTPPTMNNYMHKLLCWYMEQRIICQVKLCRIRYTIFQYQTEYTLIRQLLEELPDLGLLYLQRC